MQEVGWHVAEFFTLGAESCPIIRKPEDGSMVGRMAETATNATGSTALTNLFFLNTHVCIVFVGLSQRIEKGGDRY